VVLPEEVWHERRAAHRARVDAWVAPHLERRRRGRRHPVDDFLFDYYAFRPGQLRQWHPGFGLALAGTSADEYLERPHYTRTADGVAVGRPALVDRSHRVRRVRDLLSATAARPASFGCFGLHEWAMVYRTSPEDIRHSDWPLRLTPDEVATLVESQGLRCTHFDAFRFFTAEAEPLNATRPTSEGRPDQEQPGCLHAAMDLYRWAFTLQPLTGSDLVADCFALTREVRVLDMRASPYDLHRLGYPPVAVETPAGRAEFVAGQRAFSTRAEVLRRRLLAELDALLASTEEHSAVAR
jgi:hypothetical protein